MPTLLGASPHELLVIDAEEEANGEERNGGLMIGSVFSSSALNLTLSLTLLSSSSLDVRGRPPSLFTGSGSGFMAMGRGGEGR